MNPILAAILSFIIPGLGQAILGDVKKGITYFIIAIVLVFVAIFTAGMLGIVLLAFGIYAAYDAYKMAQELQ